MRKAFVNNGNLLGDFWRHLGNPFSFALLNHYFFIAFLEIIHVLSFGSFFLRYYASLVCLLTRFFMILTFLQNLHKIMFQFHDCYFPVNSE